MTESDERHPGFEKRSVRGEKERKKSFPDGEKDSSQRMQRTQVHHWDGLSPSRNLILIVKTRAALPSHAHIQSITGASISRSSYAAAPAFSADRVCAPLVPPDSAGMWNPRRGEFQGDWDQQRNDIWGAKREKVGRQCLYTKISVNAPAMHKRIKVQTSARFGISFIAMRQEEKGKIGF